MQDTPEAAVIRDAIVNRLQLSFIAKGHQREFCPHVLGRKNGNLRIFGWQFGGTSERGHLPCWRCINLRDISSPIRAHDGEWHRGYTTGHHEQTCIDFIDTMISIQLTDPKSGSLLSSLEFVRCDWLTGPRVVRVSRASRRGIATVRD